MNCQDSRIEIQGQFDEGRPMSLQAHAHIASCAKCRAYSERLEELDDALFDIPLERIEANLVARLEMIPSRQQDQIKWPVVAAVSAVMAFAAAVTGAFYPLAFSPQQAWRVAVAWLPGMEFKEAGEGLYNSLDGFYANFSTQLMGGQWFSHATDVVSPFADRLSPLIIWSGLAVSLVLLFIYNGFGAFYAMHREMDHLPRHRH